MSSEVSTTSKTYNTLFDIFGFRLHPTTIRHTIPLHTLQNLAPTTPMQQHPILAIGLHTYAYKHN